MCDGKQAENRMMTLMSSVQSYRNAVIECQKIARSYLAVRNARTLCLSRYWDKIIPIWWAARKKDSKKKERTKSLSLATKQNIMIQIKE
jgi:hypothetical protein